MLITLLATSSVCIGAKNLQAGCLWWRKHNLLYLSNLIGATSRQHADTLVWLRPSFTSERVQTLFFDKATGRAQKIWCLGTRLYEYTIAEEREKRGRPSLVHHVCDVCWTRGTRWTQNDVRGRGRYSNIYERRISYRWRRVVSTTLTCVIFAVGSLLPMSTSRSLTWWIRPGLPRSSASSVL